MANSLISSAKFKKLDFVIKIGSGMLFQIRNIEVVANKVIYVMEDGSLCDEYAIMYVDDYQLFKNKNLKKAVF